jgi:hypothetical protein
MTYRQLKELERYLVLMLQYEQPADDKESVEKTLTTVRRLIEEIDRNMDYWKTK